MPAVAVIGASNSPAKFGNKAVRAYLRQGWTVYPVNPNERTVEGLPTVPSIEAIPGPVDRAALYVPAAVGITLLPGIARKGVSELFVNPGAEDRHPASRSSHVSLDRAWLRITRRSSGLQPRCMTLPQPAGPRLLPRSPYGLSREGESRLLVGRYFVLPPD